MANIYALRDAHDDETFTLYSAHDIAAAVDKILDAAEGDIVIGDNSYSYSKALKAVDPCEYSSQVQMFMTEWVTRFWVQETDVTGLLSVVFERDITKREGGGYALNYYRMDSDRMVTVLAD